jgi:hypothetical protein
MPGMEVKMDRRITTSVILGIGTILAVGGTISTIVDVEFLRPSNTSNP